MSTHRLNLWGTCPPAFCHECGEELSARDKRKFTEYIAKITVDKEHIQTVRDCDVATRIPDHVCYECFLESDEICFCCLQKCGLHEPELEAPCLVK